MKMVRVILFLFILWLFAAAAQAQESSFRFTSDPGDPIGFGRSGLLVDPGAIGFAGVSSDNSIHISARNQDTNESWALGFTAPNQQLIQPGNYDITSPSPSTSQAGLNVSSNGNFCDTVTGSFVVKEVTYDNPNFPNFIVSFDATFEQHCNDLTAAIRGEIRVNAHPPVTISSPPQITAIAGQNLSFTVSVADVSARHVALSALDMPPGASFTDNGDNTGTFNWVAAANQTGIWPIIFQGDNLAGDLGARKTQITADPPVAPNDDFDHATVISLLPFTVTENVAGASSAPDDPICFDTHLSVWFAFTPTRSMELEANTFGSSYNTFLAAYTGTRGTLTQIACNDTAGGTVQSRIRFAAVAGTTYYFAVSTFFDTTLANLHFTIFEPPPPLTLSLEVSPFGVVNHPDGTVTISGVLTCSVPVNVSMTGNAEQSIGAFTHIGFIDPSIDCNGRTPWSTVLDVGFTTPPGRAPPQFHVGVLTVNLQAFAQDPETNDPVFVNVLSFPVQLRGKD